MDTIRRAVASDIEQCAVMIDHAKEFLRRQELTQWQGGYPNRLNVEQDVERGELYVMCDDSGEILGAATIVLNGEPTYAAPLRGTWLTESLDNEHATYACIHRVVCAPEHRGRGVATLLVGACERQAQTSGKRSCRMETHQHNKGMRRVAEKLGYVHCCDVISWHDQINGRVAYEKLLQSQDRPDRGGAIDDNECELQNRVNATWQSTTCQR